MSNNSKLSNPSFEAEMRNQVTPGPDRIVRREWAGGIARLMATLPQVRLGKRWFSTKQLLVAGIPIVIVLLVAGILGARYLRTFPEVQAFVAKYPGQALLGHQSTPASRGGSVTSTSATLFHVFIIRSGLRSWRTIRA